MSHEVTQTIAPISERVLGVPFPEEDVAVLPAVKSTYEKLMGLEVLDNDEFVQKHLLTTFEFVELGLWDGDEGSPTRGELESIVTLDSIMDVYMRYRSYNANSLTDWPNYQDLMDRYGLATGGTALMIGSYSPFSSRSFEVLAREMYEADQAVVVDVAASDALKSRDGFVLGSGTALPFAPGSMNYVHTNRLSHMLRDPERPDATLSDSMERLSGEIGNVLGCGGQLFMVETVPDNRKGSRRKFRHFSKLLGVSLKNAGFDDIQIDAIRDPIDNAYLQKPSPSFKEHPTEESLKAVCVYARKT